MKKKEGIWENKKGSEKYYILISMILGLMVVAIVLFFFFKEYFTSDEIDWQACRQSIILRNNLVDVDLAITEVSLKNQFPLKCKTQVLNLENPSTAEQEFADALVQCWWLAGEGKFSIYPPTWYSVESPCMICSRIHVNTAKIDELNFDNALKSDFQNGISYWEYLSNTKAIPTRGWGESFDVDVDKKGVIEPRKFNPAKGDIFVVISSMVGPQGSPGSYMVFLQQADINDGKLYKNIVEGGAFYPNIKLCSSIETIPA